MKINVQSTATLVSSAKSRRWFIMQNLSDADIFVSFEINSASVTGVAGGDPGIKLKADEVIGMGQLPGGGAERFSTNHAVYAIHETTGDKVLVIHEG